MIHNSNIFAVIVSGILLASAADTVAQTTDVSRSKSASRIVGNDWLGLEGHAYAFVRSYNRDTRNQVYTGGNSIISSAHARGYLRATAKILKQSMELGRFDASANAYSRTTSASMNGSYLLRLAGKTMVSQSFNRMAQRLESEDERRRRLLADLGHELRTPLTVIRGEIEAVIDGVHEPESLANVVDEVEIMERLLDDLRTLALAEAGGLELRLETTDLGALARDVLASFAAPLSRQNVEATLATVAEPVEVEVDPHRIHQVMSNLVSNSLAQMSDGGRLHVTVSQTEITVSDTGPGIPEDDLARVFDRFERAADSTGSGLGLSIARDLVEAHGGAIAASNRSGGGALFTITLPDQPPGP